MEAKSSMIRALMLGAGSRHEPLDTGVDDADREWVTVDINDAHDVDVTWDLNETPWPWGWSVFDEIHAYEILEHLGRQGDARAFFDTFHQCWRILKPGGLLVGTCPRWDTVWAWGDPSHTRIINEGTLFFLDQRNYAEVGITPMSDFRNIWHGDFDVVKAVKDDNTLAFWLRAVKPARRV